MIYVLVKNGKQIAYSNNKQIAKIEFEKELSKFTNDDFKYSSLVLHKISYTNYCIYVKKNCNDKYLIKNSTIIKEY